MKSVETVLKEIKHNKIAHNYLLVGEESYFIEQIINQMKQTMAAIISDDVTYYDLRETELQEVVYDLETIPFFNDKKLLIIHNPYFLKASPEKNALKHELGGLENYLKNPAPYSHAIFVAPYDKIDNRKKITKLFTEHCTVVDCQRIKEHDVSKWIMQIAKDKGLTLQGNVIAILENEFASNITLLRNEIEKLALYVGDEGVVDDDIVLSLMSKSLAQSALQLVDAVLTKNLVKALDIFKQLEKMKEEPIGMIALLAYQFRITLQVKLLQEQGNSKEQIRSVLKVHQYVVQLAMERARHFTIDELTNIMHLFTETDAAIKQGKINKSIAFELLLYELINYRN